MCCLSLPSLSLSLSAVLFVSSVCGLCVVDEKAIDVRKVCACVLGGEDRRVFASRALVWTAVYQTVIDATLV